MWNCRYASPWLRLSMLLSCSCQWIPTLQSKFPWSSPISSEVAPKSGPTDCHNLVELMIWGTQPTATWLVCQPRSPLPMTHLSTDSSSSSQIAFLTAKTTWQHYINNVNHPIIRTVSKQAAKPTSSAGARQPAASARALIGNQRLTHYLYTSITTKIFCVVAETSREQLVCWVFCSWHPFVKGASHGEICPKSWFSNTSWLRLLVF